MTEKEAKAFLNRTMTVVGTEEAINAKDEKFLTKYATVVGSPVAISVVTTAAATNMDNGDGDNNDVTDTNDVTDPNVPGDENKEE